MIATIELDIKGVGEIKTKKGILYSYRCMGFDRSKLPYSFDVLSAKNSRKPGVQQVKVNISNRKGRDGQLLPGLQIWEVTD